MHAKLIRSVLSSAHCTVVVLVINLTINQIIMHVFLLQARVQSVMPVLSLDRGLVMLQVSLRELDKLHLEACLSIPVWVCCSYKECQNLFSVPQWQIEFLSLGVVEWWETASDLQCLVHLCKVQLCGACSPLHSVPLVSIHWQFKGAGPETLHFGAKYHWLLVDVSPPHELLSFPKDQCMFQEMLLERDLIVPMTKWHHKDPLLDLLRRIVQSFSLESQSLSLETEAERDSKAVAL